MGAMCGKAGNDNKESTGKPKVLFVVGGPGSGKGTQCANLVEKYKFEHLSTGDLLRAEVNSGSEKGKELQKIMSEGGLVQTKDLIGLMRDCMKKKGWGKSKFLIDGFPRNEENMKVFGDELSSEVDLLGVLFYELDSETMKQRCLGRSEGRADDNEETIKKRLATYENETVPLVEKMKETGIVNTVSSNNTKENVFSDTIVVIDKLLGLGDSNAKQTEKKEETPDEKPQEPAKAEEAPVQKTEELAIPEGPKPKVIMVVGGPGSGKGTQCAKLVEKYGFEHLSTGDLLRAEVESGSEKGQELQRIMSEGGLVETKDLIGLMRDAMIKKGWGNSKFLIDGFPRNQQNLDVYKENLQEHTETVGFLYFELDGETMNQRCLNRGQGRADDNEETIKRRLATFENESLPLIEKM